jgi:hypothetical protein
MRTSSSRASGTDAGYQWKQVFLPEGTRLRASFGRQPYFAVVAGAQIKYGEHAISPPCFANLYGSGNRNAWKAVWLRFPGSDEWLLAEVCRSARQAAIARMVGDDAREMRGRFISRPNDPRPKIAAGFPLDDGGWNKHPSRPGSRRRRRTAKHGSGNPR